MIDNQYYEWYLFRFGMKLDKSRVLPVLHALQGHPESGKLWERHINNFLMGLELNFKHTTHDRTIYQPPTMEIKSCCLEWWTTCY